MGPTAPAAGRMARVLTEDRFDFEHVTGLHRALEALLVLGLGDAPLPGSGRTLERWQVLAAVAAEDVALVKLVEGHLDAIAVMTELGCASPPLGSTWGLWAADAPGFGVTARPAGGSALRLSGSQAWCSGAQALSHALVTCRDPDGRRLLAAVDLRVPGVSMGDHTWSAVGMAATGSVTVLFDDVEARPVGGDGDYLGRPGFWQGAAGIAACWWGAATGVARVLRERADLSSDQHGLAHLGAVDSLLAASAALLRETASRIDTQPAEDARLLALRARVACEAAAAEVLDRVGRATGAGPLCLDRAHARRVADLTVFLRQSHAERDLATLGLAAHRCGASL